MKGAVSFRGLGASEASPPVAATQACYMGGYVEKKRPFPFLTSHLIRPCPAYTAISGAWRDKVRNKARKGPAIYAI